MNTLIKLFKEIYISIMEMGLVIKSNIRKYVELSVGDEVERELEKKTEEMLKKAEERAKANGRKTIYARDL